MTVDQLAADEVRMSRAPLEFRSAQTVDVRFPDRTIEIIAVPYEEETLAEYRGKMVIESFERGSFDGVERRANRVKVNRDHVLERTVGRCSSLYPSRTEGLVAEIRIARTPLGDETLELAADGCLDASVGFAPFPGHDKWSDNRRSRRISKAFLGHIALTPDPAYEGAQMLAVRSNPRVEETSSGLLVATAKTPTPNLDLVRMWKLEERFDSYRSLTKTDATDLTD